MPNPTPNHAHKFQHSTGTTIPTSSLYKQGTYKTPYNPVCIFLQSPTLAIYNCYTLLQVVAMSLLVAVSKSSVQSMKFTRHSFQPSMFSMGYSCGTTRAMWKHYLHHHFLSSTSLFSTRNALALTRSPRGWLCISYFYILNVSGVDLRAEMSCVWSVCWGSPRVPLGLSSSNYILTLLEGWKRRNLDSYFHHLKGCDMYLQRACWLKGNPVSH